MTNNDLVSQNQGNKFFIFSGKIDFPILFLELSAPYHEFF